LADIQNGLDVAADGQKTQQKEINFISFDEFIDNNNYLKDSEIKDGELLFQHLYRPAMREMIEREFGINLNELPFHYHIHFLKFLSEKNIEEAEQVKYFLSQAQSDDGRMNRVKSFLSLEAGEEMGENIFAIGEALDQKTADAIFAKYAEIVDLTDKIREELGGMFKEGKKSFSQKEIDSISRDLIERANGLLVKFASKVKITKDAGSIMAELDNYNAGLMLAANAFKALKQSGEPIKPEDLEGMIFRCVTAAQLKDSEILAQMEKMYLANYEHEFGKTLVDGFQKLVDGDESGSTNVYYYEKNGKVAAFCRFDNKSDGTKYFGSCNVLESIKGDCIGGSMVETAMSRETANGERVLADCMFETSISSYYIEKMGFVAKAALRYKDTEKTLLAIERSDDNGKYEYRNGKYAAEDIIAENKNYSDNKHEKGAERMVLRYGNNKDGINELMKKTNELFSEGYVMTRYIFDGGDIYCAFELESGAS
jgi:predicted GNAT family acetyltransferase